MFHFTHLFAGLLAAAAAAGLSMIKRAPRQPRGRTRLAPTFAPNVPQVPYTGTVAGGSVTLSLGIPSSLNGQPTKITAPGNTLTLASMPDTQHLNLQFAGSITPTGTITIGTGETAVKGQSGGLLVPGTIIF